MNKRIKNEKGQIIVFVALSILSLAMFWIMLINIGKMIKDRIMMQNAADAAVQSAACIRSRGLNQIGALNALLGTPLFTLGVPYFVWWPCFHCNGTFHFDLCDHQAKNAKRLVEGIIKAQTGINRSYGGGWAWWAARDTAQRQELSGKEGKPSGADEILLSQLSLNLERNKGDIWYWGSLNIGWLQPILVPPFVIHKHIGPLPVPPEICGILVSNTDRWYQRSKDFHKQKITLVATKRSNSESNKGYPFGKNLFNIRAMPEIRTIASARSYNTSGPMFPERGQDFGFYAAIEYIKAMHGGWDAQLVPVGKLYQH